MPSAGQSIKLLFANSYQPPVGFFTIKKNYMGPLVAGALVGAAGQALNAGMSWLGNKSQQNNNQNNYAIQRRDANVDMNLQNNYNNEMWNKNNAYNQEMWQKQNAYNDQRWRMQNEYDSPQAQMARFKAAGINPNAMFGNMSSGQGIDAQSIAQASAPTSSGVRPSSTGSYSPSVPQFDMTHGIMTMYDAKIKGAQVDNLQATNRAINADILLKQMDTFAKGIQNEKLGYERDLMRDGLAYSLEALNLNNRKMKLDMAATGQSMSIQGNQESRNQETQGWNFQRLKSDLASAAENRLLTISTREMQDLQKKLNLYEIQLNEAGVQKSDNLLFRMLGTSAQRPIYKNGDSLMDRLKHYDDGNLTGYEKLKRFLRH